MTITIAIAITIVQTLALGVVLNKHAHTHFGPRASFWLRLSNLRSGSGFIGLPSLQHGSKFDDLNLTHPKTNMA